MRLWPTKRQWNKWSLPSKYSAIGLLIALLSVPLIFIPFWSDTDKKLSKPKVPTRPTEVKLAKKLRQKCLLNLDKDQVSAMLREFDFYDQELNTSGRGVVNEFESKTIYDGNVIVDLQTKLVWQRSGSGSNDSPDSKKEMTLREADEYIIQLNKEKFAGFKDWHLPTLEETMTLMERFEQNGTEFHIDSLFSYDQMWIWTCDEENEDSSWIVVFLKETCMTFPIESQASVRAVRSS